MSFRKRNIGLSSTSNRASGPPNSNPPSCDEVLKQAQGVRPSPLDGRPTTSTGTQSFDDLLGGHAGLALGNSVLIEENGTTDFAGALLRYYAAEGIVQGHKVHIIGVPEQWGRELPGLVGTATAGEMEGGARGAGDKEKMKIAWRYEKLGEFGTGARGGRLFLENHLPHMKGLLLFQMLQIQYRAISCPANVLSSSNTTTQPQNFSRSIPRTKSTPSILPLLRPHQTPPHPR